MITYTQAEVFAAEYLENAGVTYKGTNMLRSYGYFDAPASKGHHLAVRGGLLIHSVLVTSRLLGISENMGVCWDSKRSPYLVGMLHDFVKCFSYEEVKEGTYAWKTPRWPGHGVASALAVQELLPISLSAQESAAIVWHMGAFGLDAESLRQYNAALDAFPLQIIATHTADMVASRFDERGE